MEAQAWAEVVDALLRRNPALEGEQRSALERLLAYSREFDRQVELYSRTLIIILIPLFALLPTLVFARRRDGPVRHLVFATHWMSGFLIVSLIGGLALGIAYRAKLAIDWALFEDLILSSFTMLVMIAWTVPAARRVYGLAWWRAALLAVGLTAWLILMLQVYRSILFYLVYAML